MSESKKKVIQDKDLNFLWIYFYQAFAYENNKTGEAFGMRGGGWEENTEHRTQAESKSVEFCSLGVWIPLWGNTGHLCEACK